MALAFSKMHGAGNDFVLLDLRGGRPAPDAATVRAIAHRHTGVGFDQLLAVTEPTRPGSVAGYRIWNSDGSAAQQCGNGARCVAAWLLRDGAVSPTGGAAQRFTLDSPAGPIEVECLADGRFALEMGRPDFLPAHIPLRATEERAKYEWRERECTLRFGAASMGNPHALVEVEDVARAPVAMQAAALQNSGLFPQGVNVGFAQLLGRDAIRLRVVERGVGETLACGSGACAAVAILARQGKVDRRVDVHLPGGTLTIEWPHDGDSIRMTGPAAFVFEGEWGR
jgi:diaminopimelate epimerase